MPHDPDAFAEMVVLTIKSALAPVLERIAAAEAKLSQLPTTEKTVSDLRDRVLTVETKAAIQAPEAAGVDLTPVLERVAAVETRLSTVGDLRDRVVMIETKAAMPVIESTTVDFTPVLERMAAVETRIAAVADVSKDLSAVRERVAVVEVRAQVPGPPGKDGTDGADGIGFDDLTVVQQDERSFAIKAVRGDHTKEIGAARFPVMIHRGVYVEGKSYDRGDVVTWAGSQWHCNEPTATKPGEGSKAWTLIVKRGRDGKDGVDGRDAALPVISVGGQR